MAEQGRYDRDDARGGYHEGDDRSSRRESGREGGQGRRSDSVFGSGWDEREERGWGSSSSSSDRGGRERGEQGGISSWFGGGDRSHRDRGSAGSSFSRDRDDGRSGSAPSFSPREREEGRSGGSSWFGGGRSRERDHLGRDREWEPVDVGSRGPERDRGDRDDRQRLERERIERERMEHERLEQDRRDQRSGRERLERERSDRDDDRGGAVARDRGYGPDDHREGVPMDETGRLIASNKVEGTAVYGLDGERLGSIYNFMVEKVAGKVEYAVMTYGGFLGMGTRYYPIPWRMLKYDTRHGGYRVDLTTRELERAPSFDRSNEPNFDREYGQRVHSWYGLNY